ncbi:hypothetical protein DYB32_001719 [Aphanomyces invadans]|uniref:WW domain-containing protein n=1 Tax=Aphanomyces invadans TaxID=157072 RepID=A0A418B5D6_9STRA|nr:hypothetical protein DYB32_001719 [Aphanomyces invadans]
MSRIAFVGSILKKAESGKLIPVLFEHSESIEWVDLSSQTFKVVCFPKQIRPLSARERQLSDDANRRHADNNVHVNLAMSYGQDRINDGSVFRFPNLPEGTQIEVYHSDKSVYVKNTVVRQVHLRPYVYELHATTTGSRSVVDLAATRCKVLLKDSTGLDLRTLVAHVIEVFVKEEKRVDAGRICGCNNKGRMLQVRFQGGRKEWIALSARKLKIRLHEAPIVEPLVFTRARSMDNQNTDDDAARKTLQRSHSYSIPQIQNPPSPHPVRRSFSSSNMMIVRSPVSQLRRMKSFHNPGDAGPGHPVLARTNSMESLDGYTIDSARTVESLAESDIADPHAEWSMQIDPSSNQTYYVHTPTGTSQWHPPPNVDVHALQWIATDSMEQHHVDHDAPIVHTPIGPIEAVRHIRTTLHN